MKTKAAGYLVALAFVASPVTAVTNIYVCDTGGDYTTIQDAVDNSSDYDIITVCPGTYNENVFIENQEGLTIQSEEVSAMGPNTVVRSFQIGFAPNFGPHSVTVQGFTVGGGSIGACKQSNGVGIESAGDYNTIAHNYVTNCGGLGAIRVDEQNIGNNVHHNSVVSNTGGGIRIEGPGAKPARDHNVHHNFVWDVDGEGCIRVLSDNTNVHQNQVGGNCGSAGINGQGADYLHVQHNEVCAYGNPSLELWNAEFAHVHHNVFTGQIWNENSDDKLKKNRENVSTCPFPEPEF